MRLIFIQRMGWGAAMFVLSWLAFLMSLVVLALTWLPNLVCEARDGAEINYLLKKTELRLAQRKRRYQRRGF